jgi:CarboxypepD_reg-like domain
MKNDFTLSVPSPCHERWSEFTPTEMGRFCGSCQKEVIDFTQWNEDQIKHYFTQTTKSTCGRFHSKQLITYHKPAKPNRSWLSASILALVLLIMSRPTEAQSKRKVAAQEQVEKKFIAQQSDTIITKVTIHGVVRDALDESLLPGVNILRRGTSEGIVSDANGRYEFIILQPKQTEQLTFSFIGYETREFDLPINKCSVEIKIDLMLDTQVLGDFIVVPRYSPRRLWWKVKNIFRR